MVKARTDDFLDMNGNAFNKNIRRTIAGSIGRYIAILAIIALGVGFFVGIKVTKTAMVQTGDKYVTEHNMYDFRLVSTLGFEEADEEKIAAVKEAEDAEGAITQDFFSKNSRGDSIILRAHSITERISTLRLVEGRMPETAGECVGDKEHFTEADIGRTIEVTDENDEDTKEVFKNKKMKLVGLVDSVNYMNRTERGTASIGNGKIDAYIYLPRDGFSSDYFTEMYVTSAKGGYLYSEEYDDNIKKAQDAIEAISEKCATDRYDKIIADAQKEIDEAQSELDDGWTELENGRATLATEKKKTQDKLAASKEKLDSVDKELKTGEEQIAQGRKTAESEKKKLEEALPAAEQALEQAQQYGDEAAVAEAQAAVEQIEAGIAKCIGSLDQIDKKAAELEAGEVKVEQGYKDYYAGKKKAEAEFASAEAELASAEAELRDGEKEIEDARKELKDIEKPELYVQTRDDNLGYDSFDSNSDIVDSIAKVFPVFFFLIAALVCSTTMSRMIEEERTQIGALRAIGYTRMKIMWKYLIYSGSAAVIGCMGGFLLGSKFFPYAIWTAYNMIFDFAPLEFYFSWPLAVVSLLVSIMCSAGTTWLACRGQLNDMPAQILRPKAPKNGKRIFLEHITPVWSRLKFLHKVTARNILRYKKRMIMMIVGIAGCTALVLAGLGLYDSIADIAEHQYGEIEVYDMTAQFSEELDGDELVKFNDEYGEEVAVIAPYDKIGINVKSSGKIRSCSLMVTDDAATMQKVVKFRENDAERTDISYPGYGEALINNKLAELMGVDVGDKLTVEYDDTKTVELTVSGIYRNYVQNYVYINEATYEDVMGKTYEPDMAFIKFSEGYNERKVAEDINSFEDILGMQLNKDTMASIEQMMVSLNYIIWLVIGCAAALAFIVLFNLSNINITEREREIATIKVLGFYPSETGAYVFRENFVLVILGIIVGLPLGVVLHKFVMSQIVVDMIAFNEVLKPVSYVYAACMVILFSFAVDVIMRRKLNKVNMAEALKSTE